MTEPEVTSVTRKDIMVTIVHPDDTLKRQVVYSDLISSIIPAGYNKIQQIYRKVSDSKIYIIYTDSDDVEQTVSFTPGAGGGDMTKAEYDSDEDGVILKAQLDSDLANTSGTNTGDQTLAGLGGVAHSLATAINDFLVASGAGAFVKKTLAEVKTLLDWATDIATHAALATGIHGVGASTVESVSGSQDKVDTHAVLTTGVHGVGAGTVAKVADIAATKIDDLSAGDDNTDLDSNTTRHGLLVKAVAPAASLMNVPGIVNGETVFTNKPVFDATNPAALGVAAPGTAVIASHRDHVHLDPVTAHVVAADPHTGYLLAAGSRELSADWIIGEKAVQLDTALSGNGTYSGITEAGTAGAVLAFGDLVYLAVADSRWELADANAVATATMKLGICVLAAAGDGSATIILLIGKVRTSVVFPTLTIGAPVFVGETAGDIVVTAPVTSGAIVRVIGYGNTASELYFDPDGTWVELV